MTYEYLLRGTEDSPRLLFLPGWGHRIDGEFVDCLSRDFQVLALTFPFADPALEAKQPWTMDDYTEALTAALKDLSFAPDLAVGHSFGGKMLAFDRRLHCPLILVAPSAFAPSLSRRLRSKYRIWRNKLMKSIYLVLKRPLPGRYLGSADYQQTSGARRATFKMIKNAYVKPRALDSERRCAVIGFSEDSEIESRTLRKRVKSIKSGRYIELPGGHNALYDNFEVFYRYLVTYDLG